MTAAAADARDARYAPLLESDGHRPTAVEAATLYLRYLYGDDAPGHLPILTFKNQPVRWFEARGTERIAAEAVVLAARFNVYHGIGLQPEPLGDRERGTAATVSAIPGLWADVDVEHPVHGQAGRLPPTTQEALRLIGEFPLRPTMLVDSGHGHQAWWLFRELWVFSTEQERHEAQDLVRRFQGTLLAKARAHGWTMDTTSDLARIFRLPGTVNHKAEPRPVAIAWAHDAIRYEPGDFEEYLLDPEALDEAMGRTKGYAPAIGPTIPAGERNITLTSLAGSMRRRGASEGAIVAALREENSARCVPPLVEGEVRRIAASVASYEPATSESNGHASPMAARPEQRIEARALAEVEATFQRWLHLPDTAPVLVTAGAVAANMQDGDPVWLLMIGPPGSGKTEVLQATGRLPHVHMAATLTEAALLSGTPKREKAADAKGGLLREIGDFGILLCKDFGSVLSMHRDARAAVLAALREVFDGSWTRHVGTDGGRTLAWAGKVGLIAGCTQAVDTHHAVIGSMGERMIFYRLPPVDETKQAQRALAHAGKETIMRRELAEALSGLFAGLTVSEAPAELSEAETIRLVALAMLAVRCRSAIERDGHTRDIELIPDPEAPGRLAIALFRLLAGLRAIGVDEPRAWACITKVGLDCMPTTRRVVFDYLLEAASELDTTTIGMATSYPSPTARRTLEDLTAHHVVIREPGGPGKADRWALSDWAREQHRAATTTFPEKSGGKGGETFPEKSGVDSTVSIFPFRTNDDFSGKVPHEDDGVPF